MRNWMLALIAIVCAVVAGTAIAGHAAIPTSSGVINACYVPHDGLIHAYDPSRKAAYCAGRPRLRWNAAGTPDAIPSTAVAGEFLYFLQPTVGVMAELSSRNEHTPQEIRTTVQSRIMATAQVTIHNTTDNTVGGDCNLLISGDGTPLSGLTSMGAPAEFTTGASRTWAGTMSFVGSAVKPPGTYNVILQCKGMGARAKGDALLVWAAPMR